MTVSRTFFSLAIFLIAVVGGSVLFIYHSSAQQPQSQIQPLAIPPPLRDVLSHAEFEKDQIVIRNHEGGSFEFEVEMARTPAQQTQGLMFRNALAENAGMLFLFPRPVQTSFWMKNTFVPLDMLFLKADGTIHHIHHNAQPHDLTSVSAEQNSKAVLEIHGGLSKKFGIQEGDRVLHPFFKNIEIPQ